MKSAEDAKKEALIYQKMIELKKELRELEFIMKEIVRQTKAGKTWTWVFDIEYENNKKYLENLNYHVLPADNAYNRFKIVWDIENVEAESKSSEMNKIMEEINKYIKGFGNQGESSGNGGLSGV